MNLLTRYRRILYIINIPTARRTLSLHRPTTPLRVKARLFLQLTDELVAHPDPIPDVFIGDDDGVDERHDGRAVRGQVRLLQLRHQQAEAEG